MKNRYKYDSIIKHYLKQFPDLVNNKTALARKIISEENFPFTDDYFRRFIRSYMDRNKILVKKNSDPKPEPKIIEYNQPTPDDVPRYQIVGEEYRWESKHGTFTIPIRVANQLFYEYSRHGLDLSSTSVRLKHNISLKMWFSLKYHLGLYKDSHIISPHTLDNTPQDKLRDLINERMAAKEKDKENVIVEEHNKATIAEYNKLIKNIKTRDIAIERMLDDLSETITIPKVVINDSFSPMSYKKDHIVAAIADLHVGAMAKNLIATDYYDTNIVRERLDAVASEINAMSAAKVTVLVMGDLIESATGLNHINSWRSIQDGMYGAKVFKEVIEILIEFFNKINNLVEIVGISGNHDRIAPRRDEDMGNSLAEMIFYTISKIYENITDKVNIKFHYLLESIEIDGINYIISHGDKNVFKKKDLGTESVLVHGNPLMFNVVLTGHLHSRAIIADHSKYRWIQVPSIFSGNFYSEENGFHARPGFTIMYNKNTYPVVIDYTL